MPIKLSIVIPTWNESGNIVSLLKNLPQRPDIEIIVSDGSSTDNTVELAQANRAIIAVSTPGRGIQLNRGADLARGKTILFLHADAAITDGGISEIIKIMESGKYIGGAFYLNLRKPGALLRLIISAANLRSRLLKTAYGDQGIFADRGEFKKLEGFAETPLMEDYDFFRRLRKKGKVILIKKGLLASSRRWEKEGILYTTIRNWTIFLLYRLGTDPASLKKWYRDIR